MNIPFVVWLYHKMCRKNTTDSAKILDQIMDTVSMMSDLPKPRTRFQKVAHKLVSDYLTRRLSDLMFLWDKGVVGVGWIAFGG